MQPEVEQPVLKLFALVSEALSRATWALLNGDVALGQTVVAADREIDEQTASVERLVWVTIEGGGPAPGDLRQLVAVLLILSELERSADLAEHIAQRAVANVGADMTPVSRGIVQRMSEVAVEMWRSAADAYAGGRAGAVELHEADEELDLLHERLSEEVATGTMLPPVAAQVTLIARFYERIGDHAVNLSRRTGTAAGR
ncbi:MAG: phosphate signaling complex PhoU family protein [Acidimicrobiales bacterium]